MFHTKPYDNLSFMLPMRMFGNLLFCENMQSMKKERKGGILWEKRIKYGNLKKKGFNNVEMFLEIYRFKFLTSVKLTAADQKENLDLFMFGDSNSNSFGSVVYAVFDIDSGGKM